MAEKKDKKDEKDSEVFVLKLNTDNICFANQKLGDENTNASMKLSNPTKDIQAFKVKCTSNEMFKIKTPVGILKPDESVDIGVVHCAGKAIPESNKQYFAIYYVKMDSSVKAVDVREEWKKKTKHDGVKRVFISFDKGDKKDEKKKKDSEIQKTEEKEKKEKDTQEEKKDEDKKEDKKEEKKDEDEKK